MTPATARKLHALIAISAMLVSFLALEEATAAATPKTTTTTAPSAASAETILCGANRARPIYHGTNAERELERENPDPLKVVNFPCNFSSSTRGIRLNSGNVQLVAGGKLVRTITSPNSGPMTLPYLTQLIDQPSWLAQTSPSVFQLKASIVQEARTTLDIQAPAVTLLRMDFQQGDSISGSDATANFDGVTVESWDPKTKKPITTPRFGRPFVLYENTSQLNILHSTMEYLGSDETSSYGVSWRVGGSNGTVNDSLFQHNFFGVYTFQAAHVTFENSTFRDNTFYGIDPHTNSTHLTITNNDVYDNSDHGIVFSRYVTDSVVSKNRVYDNKVNGIMMDFHSNGNVIKNNVVSGNAQGIVMSDSAQDVVSGNTITDNGVGIRASHAGADLDNIHNNRITGGTIGIQLYGGATTSRVTKNVIAGPTLFGMVLDSARSVVTGNRISDTPTAMQVLTAVTVVGGTLQATQTGIDVGAEGFASVHAVGIDAGKPISQAPGSIVQLYGTSFHLSHTTSTLSGFDIAAVLILLFAILCEIQYLARERSVKRVAHNFSGISPSDTLVERQITRMSKLSVRIHAPPSDSSRPEAPITSEANDPVRRFRPDIEGLRAVAVVFVILSHASLGLPGGYVGVDIFFVISGFLITQQLLRDRERSGRTSFVKFYARRARRILPAATVVTCATLLFSFLVISPLRLPSITKDAVAAAFFSLNWRLAAAGTNYFNASTPPSPFQHYWSLSVEEQFYLVWPVLIVMVAVLCRRRVGLKWPLTIVLGTIIGTSLWASIHVTKVNPSFAYFGTDTRAWELATGALVAVWGTKLARLPRLPAVVIAWIGIGAMAWAGITLSGSTAYPGWIAQIPVYGAALVIAAGCGAALRSGPERVLGLSLFQRTGKISYSLYLWHWPLLILLPDFLGHAPSWEDRVAAICVAIALSVITFVMVEQPVRNSNWLIRKPRRALTVGAALVGTSLVVALVVSSASSIPSRPSGAFTTPELSAAISQASSGGKVTSLDSVTAALDAAEHLTSVPSNVTPPLGAVPSSFPASTENCEVSLTASLPTLPCDQFGDPNGKTHVVLVGDSHAGMWLPAVNVLAQQNHWKLTFLAKSGCPIGDYPNFVLPGDSTPYTTCNTWRSAVIADIVNMKPAIVIVASEARQIAATEPTGMTKSLDELAQSSAKVIFLADVPYPGVNIPDCLAQHQNDVAACDISIANSGIEAAGRQAEIADANAAGIPVIDPTPWFCTNIMCPVIIQDTIVYMDTQHITGAYALLREPQLAAAINSALSGN